MDRNASGYCDTSAAGGRNGCLRAFPTANKAMAHLVAADIARELTGQRDLSFCDILGSGGIAW